MRVVALGVSCNNACVFCAQGELRAREGALSDADVARIDDALRGAFSGEIVAFAGGEPTLLERLPTWIRAAHDGGAASILVQTNGRRLAYRSYAGALREASPRLGLDVSLHGSTEAMHDYHTATPGSFRQTVTGMRSAQALGVPLAVTVVVTRSNFRHLAEIVEVAQRVGAAAIKLVVAQAYGSAARAADRVIPAWELVEPRIAEAVVAAKRRGLGVVVGDEGGPPDVRARFVGIGRVEELPAPERKHRLPVLGRPAPGKQETRVQARQTGEDLKTILPNLFANPSVVV